MGQGLGIIHVIVIKVDAPGLKWVGTHVNAWQFCSIVSVSIGLTLKWGDEFKSEQCVGLKAASRI